MISFHVMTSTRCFELHVSRIFLSRFPQNISSKDSVQKSDRKAYAKELKNAKHSTHVLQFSSYKIADLITKLIRISDSI